MTFSIFVWQNYGKRHKKALDKSLKSDAEGESLKVVSEFCNNIPIIFPPQLFGSIRNIHYLCRRIINI